MMTIVSRLSWLSGTILNLDTSVKVNPWGEKERVLGKHPLFFDLPI